MKAMNKYFNYLVAVVIFFVFLAPKMVLAYGEGAPYDLGEVEIRNDHHRTVGSDQEIYEQGFEIEFELEGSALEEKGHGLFYIKNSTKENGIALYYRNGKLYLGNDGVSSYWARWSSPKISTDALKKGKKYKIKLLHLAKFTAWDQDDDKVSAGLEIRLWVDGEEVLGDSGNGLISGSNWTGKVDYTHEASNWSLFKKVFSDANFDAPKSGERVFRTNLGGRLWVNGDWPGTSGGGSPSQKVINNQLDIRNVSFKDLYKEANNKAFKRSLNLALEVSGSSAVLTTNAVGLQGFSKDLKTYGFNELINMGNLKKEVYIDGRDDTRFKLIDIKSKGSATRLVTKSDQAYGGITSIAPKRFNLQDDSTLNLIWRKQYRLQLRTIGSGSSEVSTVSINNKQFTITGKDTTEDIWVFEGDKVEIVTPKIIGTGQNVKSLHQYAFKSSTTPSSSLTPDSNGKYKILIASSMNQDTIGQIVLTYDDKSYALKKVLDVPIKIDGTPAFSNNFADISDVPNGQKEVTITKVAGTEIDPSVKTLIFNPDNPDTRYKLSSVEGSGSASHLTKDYSFSNSYSLNKFDLAEDSSIRYKWKTQHKLKLTTNRGSTNGLPIVMVDGQIVRNIDNRVVVSNSVDGVLTVPKENLAISLEFKGSGSLSKNMFFSLGDKNNAKEKNLFFYYQNAKVCIGELGKTGSDDLACWAKSTNFDPASFTDGKWHSLTIEIKKESDQYVASLSLDGKSKVTGTATNDLEKEYLDEPSSYVGNLYVGNNTGGISSLPYQSYSGEIANLRLYSHQSSGNSYVNANQATVAIAAGTSGVGDFWVDSGSSVKLLIPVSGLDNVVAQGLSLTAANGLSQSAPMTKVTVGNAHYYQVALTDSMNISNAGSVVWNFGTKVHAFDAVIGKTFSLDKAIATTLKFDPLLKTSDQVSEKVLKGIQGSHKPKLFGAVENAPALSNELNALVYVSQDAANDATSLGRDIYKGQMYFTRPGLYRMEWQLGGTDFPIENAGVPKLIVEVNVKWPDSDAIDYYHVAETAVVPLDTSATDDLAFKELRLVQRFKNEGTVADLSTVEDVTVPLDTKSFTFPVWKDSNTNTIYRSVLLFSKSQQADKAATGDLSKEDVLIKVVESRHWKNKKFLTEEEVIIGQEVTNTGHGTDVPHNGYVLKNKLEKARYNPMTYDHNTLKGQIFAVNQEAQSATTAKDGTDDLVVAWYKHYPEGKLNWPYKTVRYSPKWPSADDAKVGRIVVASRLGSDGLRTTDSTSRQVKFDPTRYDKVAIYNQPDAKKAGFNPNEEHALIKSSYFYSTDTKRPVAAYALRNDLNQKDNTQDAYTSEPFVLVQYQDKNTKVYEQAKYSMKLYKIVVEDKLTSDVHASYKLDTNGDGAVDSSDAYGDGKFTYVFDYPMYAGDKVVAPYPLNTVIGASSVNEVSGTNPVNGSVVYWEDKDGNSWVIAGDSYYLGSFWYPMQDDFWHPVAKTGDILPFAVNSNVSALSDAAALKAKSKYPTSDYFVSNGKSEDYTEFNKTHKVRLGTFWKAGVPEIRLGETLTFAGGEEKKDNAKAVGLPSAVAWASAEVVHDGLNKLANVNNWMQQDKSSVIVKPAVREIKVSLPVAEFPGDINKEKIGTNWFFKDLHAGLKQRIYYDDTLGKLVLRGILNDRFAGDPLLTKSPGGYNYMLQPNVLTQEDLTTFLKATENSKEQVSIVNGGETKEIAKKDRLREAFWKLYALSLNPNLTDTDLATVKFKEATAQVTIHDSVVSNVAGLSSFLRDKNNRLLVMTDADFAVVGKVKGSLQNDLFPTGLTNEDLELVAVNLSSPESVLPHGMAIEDSVTQNEIRAGGKLVRIKKGKGYIPASQLGTGLAVFTNPNLLKHVGKKDFQSHLVIAENNDPSIKGSPVQLHIMKVNNRPYRGQIKTVLSDNVFDEKIALRHTGDFGGDASQLVFEWRYRESDTTKGETPPALYVDPSCPVAVTPTGKTSVWNTFTDSRKPAPLTAGLGRNELVFGEAAGKDVLVDNSFYVRYAHKDSCDKAGTPDSYVFDSAQCKWTGWAGAGNNNPCAPAYASQLVKGWVKRVTDQVNQYDARISNFSAGAPATYVSMVEQAGAAYVGDVALNPSKDVIENTGLIALYQTVLNRAKNLSISAAQPDFTQGVGGALLNAASRISQFYMLLGNEAYSDALDPTIGFSSGSGEYGSLAPTIFTFQNQLPTLADEELALLRGRSELGGAPVHNRLLWNFTNNDGEAAYALSYAIKDKNTDGSINEKDAKIMFPQGHGDAWGHYLSAVNGYYTLMKHKEFSWVPRSEQYEVDGVTVKVDYLDERRFAEAAAAKAKVGSEVIGLTYRQMYEEDPDGQWQGYKDTNAAQGWGVDGWVRRAHQGAYFDWITAHAMLPAEDKQNEGIQKIDRTTVPELQEISINGNLALTKLAEINNGQNPLGILPEAVPFDIEPGTDKTQFEQVYVRAEQALTNAKNVFDYANNLKNRIRKVADTQEDFSEEVYKQDREYRNRLIEFFGTPYEGVVGAGKVYPEGYDGPDVYYYQYLDVGEISDKTLAAPQIVKAYHKKFGSGEYKKDDAEKLLTEVKKEYFKGDYSTADAYSKVSQFDVKDGGIKITEYPLSKGNYSMTAPSYWGQRKYPGSIQMALTEILKADVDLRLSSKAYSAISDDIKGIQGRLTSQQDTTKKAIITRKAEIADEKALALRAWAIDKMKSSIDASAEAVDDSAKIAIEALPKSAGTSNDVTAPARASILAAAKTTKAGIEQGKSVIEYMEQAKEYADEVQALIASVQTIKDGHTDAVKAILTEVDGLLAKEPEFRLKVFKDRETVRQASEKYRSLLGKASRMLEERQAFNKRVASKTHGKRYQDMAFRLNRTEASQKYRSAFDMAAKYAYLAAKAYDYETNLSPKHSASAQHVLKDIVQARTLGQVDNGEPVVGQGGLADTLARLKANFGVLKTQMGFNNPQLAEEPFSLRKEAFRVKTDAQSLASQAQTMGVSVDQLKKLTGATGNLKWRETLGKFYTNNIWDLPEYRTQMRPFAAEASGKQPGLVIPFSTSIISGKNFFGFPLAANDHAYDSSQFSTRIQSVGIWMEGYKGLGLAETARAYLVPVGQDVMYVPDSLDLDTREWNVKDQKIPAPLPFGKSDMESSSWMPLQALDGPNGQVRRHSQLRVYHDSGEVDPSKIQSDSRLFGRSVWNNRWLLVIPGAALLADSEEGIQRLIHGKPVPGQTKRRDGNGISDIKLIFKTYAYSGN